LVLGSSGTPIFSASAPLSSGGDELVENRALDIDPLGAQADLAAVLKAAERSVPSMAASKSQSANTMAGVLAAHFQRHRTMPSAPPS
jgi:hypothetical protein